MSKLERPSGSSKKTSLFKQISKMTKGERGSLLLMLVLSLLVAFTEGLGITILLPLLDPDQKLKVPFISDIAAFLNSFDVAEKLYIIALILGCLLLMRASAIYFSQQLEMKVPSRISRRIAFDMHQAYLRSDLEFARRRSPGEIHSLIVVAPERATKVLKGVLRIIVMLPLVVVSIAIMMVMSWTIATFSLLTFSALYFGVRAILSGHSETIGKKLSLVDKNLSQSLFDSIRLLVPVKLMNAQGYMASTVDNRYAEYVEWRIKQNKVNAAIGPLISVGAGAAMIAILVGVATFSADPSAEISRLLILVIAMSRLPGPTAAIGASRMQILSNLHAMNEIEAFIAGAQDKQERGTLPAPEPVERITFSDVEFCYPGEDVCALRDLEFTLSKGEFVAVVGASGSGKSTLLSLLAGFYAPTKGGVLLGDTNLQAVDLSDWRRRIGYVTQDISLFHGTIFENIAFQRPDVSDHDAQAAAEMAGLDSFIDSLPGRYQAMIGDSERSLSGGQKQRLMIARALANRPQILIFDEATASLDTESEAVVQETVEKLRGLVTIIWVSHRMHTVRTADLIIVLKEGALVAVGDHSTLLRESQAYQALLSGPGSPSAVAPI